MMRVLERAANCLIECEYIDKMWFSGGGDNHAVFFRRRAAARPKLIGDDRRPQTIVEKDEATVDNLKVWLASQDARVLADGEAHALESGFGSELERSIVCSERMKGGSVGEGGRIRQEYVRRFLESSHASSLKVTEIA